MGLNMENKIRTITENTFIYFETPRKPWFQIYRIYHFKRGTRTFLHFEGKYRDEEFLSERGMSYLWIRIRMAKHMERI